MPVLAAERHVGSEAEESSATGLEPKYDKSWAVIIGIDDYLLGAIR